MARTIFGNVAGLGALPAILISVITTMIKYEWTEAQITRALGEQYEEMQRLSEAEITELAVILEEETGTPSWKWFTILRNAKEIGFSRNAGANGDGAAAPPPPPPPRVNGAAWIAIGVGVLALFLLLRQ